MKRKSVPDKRNSFNVVFITPAGTVYVMMKVKAFNVDINDVVSFVNMNEVAQERVICVLVGHAKVAPNESV